MTLPRESLVKMNRGLYRYNVNPTIVTGTFTILPAGTFYLQETGQGATTTRNAAGDYTITIDDTDVTEIFCATACLQTAGAAHTDQYVRVEDIAVAAGVGTVDLKSLVGAVETDVLEAGDLFCHYQIIYGQGWNTQPDTNPLGFYHHESDPTLVCGRVAIGAAGAPGAITGAGVDSVVGGGGTGIYTITFTEAFNQMIGAQVSCGNLSATAAADLSCNLGAFTAGGAGAATLLVYTQAAAVATDPNNGGSINWAVTLAGESAGA